MNTLRLEAAAARASCHPETLRKMMKAGEAPGTKIGRAWIVSEELFQQWIDNRCQSIPVREAERSGLEAQSLAKSIASHRKQLIEAKQKNSRTHSEPASGAAGSSATVVPFRLKRLRGNG